MAYCPKCGREIKDGQAFCPGCGAQITGGSAGASLNVSPQGPSPSNTQGPADLIKDPKAGKPIASLVLGIVSLFLWLVPLLGLPVSVCGLVFSIKALKTGNNKGMAMAGLIMAAIGLGLVLVNGIFGAIMGASGQYF